MLKLFTLTKFAVYATIVATVTISGAAIAHHGGGDGDNGPNVIYGTPGNDKLVGGHGPDVFYAGRGNDKLWGGRGPDVFNCGPGFDVVHNARDTGNDTINPNCERVLS